MSMWQGLGLLEAAVKILYSPEEQARQEIRSYVNDGLKEYDVVLTRRVKNDIIDIGDYIAYTLLSRKQHM